MPKRTDTESAFSVRVTQEQRAIIKAAAEAEDRTPSSFLRVAAMARASQVLGLPVGQCNTDGQAQASGAA
jgi:uncharacterized protein (DUF1778 family)